MTIDIAIEVSQSTSAGGGTRLSSATEIELDRYTEPVSPTAAVENKIEMETKQQQDSERAVQTDESRVDEGLPIDKGWAWVVLAGAAFCFTLFGGIKKNFGLFFVAIQDRFGSSASLTSVVVTIQRLLYSFISLITMTVGMKFMSNRMAVMLGAMILTISYIISAFATDVRMLFVSLGFMEGIGRALLHPTVMVSLVEYFNKRRGLANGLAFSGASFGGLIFAPVFAELFEKLGYSGTFLIVAGMTLTFLVTGALIKPLRSFKRQTSINMETNEKKEGDDDKDDDDDNSTKKGSVTENQETSFKNSEDTTDILKLSFLSKIKTTFDMTLFKTFVFPVFLLMASMLATTSDLLQVFLAPLSNDLGLTADQIGILMTVVRGAGLLSRFLCGIFADREFFNLTTLLAVVSTIAGLTAHCASFFTSFSLLVVMAILLGLTCEIYHSMYLVVLVDYLTRSKAKSCMGFTTLCHGVAVASTYPLVGWLRDTTGSYYASYHFLGTMSFIGAISALSLPCVHRKSKRK